MAIAFALGFALYSTTAFAAGLFIDAPAASQKLSAPKTDSAVLKERAVRVDFAELASQLRPGGTLELNLFDDFSPTALVEKLERRSPKDFTLSGHLENDGLSTFVLSVLDGVIALDVRTGDGQLYQVRFLQDGTHEVRLVNQRKFPECAVEEKHAIAFPLVAADEAGQPQADLPDLIDVMVLYTAAAKNAAGGSNEIILEINNAVALANTAYQESQINTRIQLVHAQEVTYTESGAANGYDTALNNLDDPLDGALDDVQGLRDTYGADMVSLLINNTNSCGLAFMMTSLSPTFEADAFSVVGWDCAAGNFSLAHELAHNMGCAHNRENAGGQGLYSYSYGWRFDGTSGGHYRTIMAYDQSGSAFYTRIQRFSNPNVLYEGTATGITAGQPNESDNAQTINNTASTVANFRQSIYSTNLSPTISSQPQSLALEPGETATFSVTASGTPPLFYFWRKGNTNIPGATASSYNITNVQLTDTNFYSVIVSNAFGFVTSSDAELRISNLGESVDNPGLSWSAGVTAPWVGVTGVTHDGIDAAQSGVTTNFGYSTLRTTIVGPGTLSFWWKVSSEEGYDGLNLFMDSVLLDPLGISGNVDWTPRTFSIPAGTHTLEWEYSKDGDFDDGQDRGWVDQILYVAGSSFDESSLHMTNGNFQLTFNGMAGATYRLQASTNLTSWVTLTNVLSKATNTTYLDPAPANLPHRFYRVISP